MKFAGGFFKTWLGNQAYISQRKTRSNNSHHIIWPWVKIPCPQWASQSPLKSRQKWVVNSPKAPKWDPKTVLTTTAICSPRNGSIFPPAFPAASGTNSLPGSAHFCCPPPLASCSRAPRLARQRWWLSGFRRFGGSGRSPVCPLQEPGVQIFKILKPVQTTKQGTTDPRHHKKQPKKTRRQQEMAQHSWGKQTHSRWCKIGFVQPLGWQKRQINLGETQKRLTSKAVPTKTRFGPAK